tara:strand:- start:192 stop:392 length:201 start_codon:yes stop_codon:yes gene_type:complete
MQGKFTGVCGSRKNLELALLKTGETPEEIEASFQGYLSSKASCGRGCGGTNVVSLASHRRAMATGE